MNILKQIYAGIMINLKWYGRRIRESKWWLIPFVLDMLFIPVKVIVMAIMCVTKRGRMRIYAIGLDFLEEMED